MGKRSGQGALWVLIAVALGLVSLVWMMRQEAEPTVERSTIPSARVRPAVAVAATRRTALDEPAPAPPKTVDPVAAEVELDPALVHGALRGRVVSSSSHRGVPKAEVSFVREGNIVATRADDQGEFELVASAAGTYTLAVVTADGFLPYAPELGHSPVSFTPRAGRRVREVTIYLSPAIDYQGLVLDPDGAPVAQADVQLFGVDSGERSLVGLNDRFVSGGDGRFTFNAPDGAVLEASHADWSTARATLDGTAQVNHSIKLVLGPKGETLAATTTLEGTVVDAQDVALAGVQVWASGAGPGVAGAHGGPQTSTDDAGAFVLKRVEVGRNYTVSAVTQQHTLERETDVMAGTTDLKLVLGDGGAIRGTLVDDETGEPVASATVAALAPRDTVAQTVFKRQAVFDAQGHYVLQGLPEGTYTVVVVAHGYARTSKPGVVVAGPDAAQADLRLSRGGSISGRVLDATSGKALAAARVTIETAGLGGADSALPALLADVTDDSGSFVIRGISPGRHSLTAVAFRHHPRTVSGLVVEQGENVGAVKLELDEVVEGEAVGYDIVGIGAQLRAASETLVIVRVIEGGGAAEAGLRGSDEIVAVDGEQVAELGFENAIQSIRGKVGTLVVLEVRRGDEELAKVEVTRARVRSG